LANRFRARKGAAHLKLNSEGPLETAAWVESNSACDGT
jgi:hypothetical protein